MDCLNCGYRLFGARDGRCPECGKPFSVFDYSYETDEVYFACPYCQRPYYGSGPDNHPTNVPATCENCGKRLFPAKMVVIPIVDHASGVPIKGGVATPWEARKPGTFITSFFSAWWQLLTAPRDFFIFKPECPDYGQALIFGMLVTGICLVGKVAVAEVLESLMFGRVFASLTFRLEPGNICAGTAVMLTIPIMAVMFWVYVIGGLVHFTIALWGAEGSTFAGTAQAMLYGLAGMCLLVIPGVGIPLALMLTVWITAVGISRTHNNSLALCLAMLLGWVGGFAFCCGGPVAIYSGLLTYLKTLAAPSVTPPPLLVPATPTP